MLGPLMLIGALTIYLLWTFGDLPSSGIVVFLVGSLGLFYTGLWVFWRGPVPTQLAFILVSLEGCLAPSVLWSDATFDLDLARQSSAALIAFVAVALSGLRYRPWLVVYAGILGAGLTAISYPVFCPAGNSEVVFCHPGLYWWRPIFILLVAFTSAITVAATLKTFSLTERTIFEREETDRLAAAKQRFMANVTHELRTPLNSILVLSKLLQEAETQSPKEKRQAEVIHNAGSSLLALINDILDRSKMEAGGMVLSPQRIELAAVAAEINALFSPIASEKHLKFSVQRAPSSPVEMTTDPLRLHQILRNLVGNALKFTDSGRVTILMHGIDDACVDRLSDVALAAEIASDRDRFLAFSVQDTGVGIEAEAQDHIFAAFVQANADTAQRFGGTGLGLSICAQLAQLMGGAIGLESSLGHGATFTLVLPVEPRDEAILVSQAADPTVIDGEALQGNTPGIESTNPGTAATTRIREEVLRSVSLSDSPGSHARSKDEGLATADSLDADASAMVTAEGMNALYQGKLAIIAHEDVLINYRAASALEALGLEVISRTSEVEVKTALSKTQSPDLFLVSPALAHLAGSAPVPTILVSDDELTEAPLPDGIAEVLLTPVEPSKLQSLLRAHLLETVNR